MNLWPYRGSLPHQHVQKIIHSYRMSSWDRDSDLYWELIELVRVTIEQTNGCAAFAGLPPDDLHGLTDKIEPILKKPT